MRNWISRFFKSELHKAEQELKSFVRIKVWWADAVYPQVYHVTKFDHKNNRMHFFKLGEEGMFCLPIPKREKVEFLDAGQHDLLGHNHEFNAHLAKLYHTMDRHRDALVGKRIRVGRSRKSKNPLYLTPTGMYNPMTMAELEHWPDLPFSHIGLHEQVPGVEHYHYYNYYAIYGSRAIIPDMTGAWEPNPHYRCLQQEQEDRLTKEYNEYLKADHFRRGDQIQFGNELPVVFIRYSDPDRTGMIVYPNGEIKGIRKILGYRLIQRAEKCPESTVSAE